MADVSEGPYAAMQTAISVVETQQSMLNGRADQWTSVLNAALAELSSIRVGVVAEPTAPVFPTVPDIRINTGNAPKFSRSDVSLPEGAPATPSLDSLFSGLDSVVNDPIPAAPLVPTLTVPSAPSMRLPTAPVRPDVDMDVGTPDAPVYDLPDLEGLKDIPEFTFEELPDFDGEMPEMTLAVPNVFINWAEPKYESELLSELTVWVKRYMQGGTGLPPHVEDALFARSRDRISAETRKAVQEATATFAARGFSMPPGAMAKQVNVAREEGRARTAELNRDILIEATKWEIENIRFAVQQGIAIEQLLQNIFENAAKRMFEVARFGAEAQISVFNAQISLFNAQLQAYNALQATFRIKLDAALAKLEAFKAEIQATTAHNSNAVEVFKAKFIGVQQAVETFKAMMDAAKIKATLIEAQFQAYRSDVQAFAEQIAAEKIKFDVYESTIKGQTAKASLFESQSRAWATTVQAIANKADTEIKGKQLKMEAARVQLGAYDSGIRGWSAKVDATMRNAELGVRGFQAEVDGWRAGAAAETANAEMLQRFADMRTRTHISYYEANLGAYQTKMQHAVQQAQIALEAAKAVGQYSAQLAAGALSAINVSAGVSGSGSQSGSVSESKSTSTSTSHNYSY